MKCNPEDTIGDLKKLIAAQTGTKYDKIVLKKWYTIFKDQIKLCDCKSCDDSFRTIFLDCSLQHMHFINSFLHLYMGTWENRLQLGTILLTR